MTAASSLPSTARGLPKRTLRPRVLNVFALVGGPGAWFIQLCLGDLMASGGCYRGSTRFLGSQSSQAWTWPVMIVLLVICALIALAAFLVSWRRFRGTGAAKGGAQPSTTGDAAAHFMALWGTLLGAGFCLAALLTIVAYATVPRCG